MSKSSALFLAATLGLAACNEPAAPRAPVPQSLPTRFVVANDSDSLIGVGFLAILQDTAADATLRDGVKLVNPMSPGYDFGQRGPSCHLGCVVLMRVDLFWQRRSFQLAPRVLLTEADTLLRFRWPTDTATAIEVPYAGDAPYCLIAPVC